LSQLLEALGRLAEAATVLRRERALAPIVKKAERQIGIAFSRQGREFVGRLGKIKGAFVESALLEKTAKTPTWEKLFTAAELATLAAFEDPISMLMRAAIAAGARVAMADFAVEGSFDLAAPEAVAFLKGRAAERVTMINATTREEMRTLVTEAMDKGWGYDKTARAIREKFEGFAGKRPQAHIQSRAHMVAVTEAGEAYEEGSLQVIKGATGTGLDFEKSWLTVGDSKVSALCATNQGAGWIPVADAFPSGHDRPLGHPACRCTALYQRKRTDKEVR
jgi:hypothetical protein